MALASAILLFGVVGCSAETAVDGSEFDRPANFAEYDALFADWAPRYIECARSYGADAKLYSDGSISPAYAPGRPVDQGLDADCVKEVGPAPLAPMRTDSFLRGLYELLVEQAECLRDNGYSISEPPSRDEWVETYDGYSWNPLMDVHDAGLAVVEADYTCPQPDPREAERRGTLG